jgi:ATP-dependent helicase/nuclease subunit B
MVISWQDHPASHERLAAAAAFIRAQSRAGRRVVVVGASRAAADELAVSVGVQTGGLAGVERAGLAELAMRLALPVLTRQGVLPTPLLGDEAVAARAAFESAAHGELRYFSPVAGTPGFPRALARTLTEIRMAGLGPAELVGDDAIEDLGRLLTRALGERRRAGAVDHALLLATAAEAAAAPGALTHDAAVLLLDVPLHSVAEARFARALLAHAAETMITSPPADQRTRELLAAGPPAIELRAGDDTRPAVGRAEASSPPATGDAAALAPTALDRLRRHVFDAEPPPVGAGDDTVLLFSAPGEGREAVEIARRLLDEAARGVPFDDMAVLVRAPHTYLSLLEHALDRAGIPAWYHRGTRRPDPAGRAFLALMTCAEEGLSARRFAEYVSLGQVPEEHGGAHEGAHGGAHDGAPISRALPPRS